MDNKAIANTFLELGQLMELHGESPFKTKAYQNAYLSLKKLGTPLNELSDSELKTIPGIGSAIQEKIKELLDKGSFSAIEKYREMTPPGVREILQVKGLGPKKVQAIWKELQIESIGELLYACQENRLTLLDGFGAKTQAAVEQNLQFFLDSQGWFRYKDIYLKANELLSKLQKSFPGELFTFTGALIRQEQVLSDIELLCSVDEIVLTAHPETGLVISAEGKPEYEGIPVIIYYSDGIRWGNLSLQLSSSDDILSRLGLDLTADSSDELAIFSAAGLPFIHPAKRNSVLLEYRDIMLNESLIENKDIKGVLHAHSNYSDGLNTLEEMAASCIQSGYEYLGITDHSKSAFYAHGLEIERVLQQWREIDQLNERWNGSFKIFKGIESDILYDGRLDYEDDILEGFDFVIASIHSILNMDEAKATQRLITAIENPYTRILGHPTGRLLLSRKGYPIDHIKIIDAAAANDVVIEINANPHRLDLDWTWIPYATKKGLKLSINPDAHSIGGISDIEWGVAAAQKGGLEPNQCLCCLSLLEIENYFKAKRH
ncbi:MAG: PHP domain-containing protein [Saprospiraceae bacterium]|nr:PHP domain-containing protein [Saprospiraceae bacterium]